MTEASATLHLVFSAPGLQDCRAQLGAGDAIVLLEDAVCARSAWEPIADVRCCALQPDLNLRGLSDGHDTIRTIDHAQLVTLCIEFARNASWR
jgi:sulfur relay protein TusB/DsrH